MKPSAKRPSAPKGPKRPVITKKPFVEPKKAIVSAPQGESKAVLNAYISQAGICSRRKAVELIKQGLVTVNGLVIAHPAHRIEPTDVVKVQGKAIGHEEKVYILFNKPKDCITTLSDEKGRKTVMPFIADATKQRVFPVGRLDRNTTGLLLLTNDGYLAQALAHPKNQIVKTYHVVLNALLPEATLEVLRKGVMLEDGKADLDSVVYLKGYKDA
ncbi:MAG TPA: pseudouridine synthase, partial [Candidatus Limnocylindria bacterium]|nr:pseudouridine synthase [Candidatus Limnocylindria bacterium]